MEQLSLEIVAEIVSYLDYVDQENVYVSSRQFFHARAFTMFLAIEERTKWLQRHHNARRIPRNELLSHNAFLRLANRTFTATRPSQETTKALATYYANELIAAWMVPVNVHGYELRYNDSLEDQRLYQERYPLLERLGTILRWIGGGRQVAQVVQEWLDTKWEEIKEENEVLEFINPDYDLPSTNIMLQPHQTKILRGLEFLALFPIIYYAPQDAASEQPDSRISANAWQHPGFHRLKLWLSIPEMWNMEIRHLEIRQFLVPQWRVYRQVAQRPMLQVVLFRSAEFVSFAQQVLKHIRTIETSAPYINPYRGARYWYEEGFVASALHWNFYLLSFPGQYISLFEKIFVDIIRGYIHIFGTDTLSWLVLNIVFFVKDKAPALRELISQTVMSELLIFGYDYLHPQARHAVVELSPYGTRMRGVTRDKRAEDQPPRGPEFS